MSALVPFVVPSLLRRAPGRLRALRDGLPIQVTNCHTLIELKRLRGSKLDLDDVEAIELLDRLDD